MKLLLQLTLSLLFLITGYAQVRLQFTSVNQYGNNLYIDNLALGTKSNTDIAVATITNIRPDTNYAIGNSAFSIAPVATIVNVGRLDYTTPFTVTLAVTPGVYASSKNVTALAAGQAVQVVFDNLTITPGTPIVLTLSHNAAGDENAANNVKVQNTLYSPGTQRTILFEEWTSSTCGPCASNNPTVDAFVSAHFDSLVPVKYHMNWPSPGNDPMYAHNATQATDRRTYYGVNSVPHVIMDGVVNPVYPYTTAGSLPNAFYGRRPEGSPISLSVTNQKIAGDSMRTTVTMNVISRIRTGNYYLRVHAIERVVHYATAPGTNGEKDFYDVFRRAYPTSLGTPISVLPGTYQFVFTYKMDTAVWVDSMMYAIAFVQNDANREILNAAKSRNILEKINTAAEPKSTTGKPEPAPVPVTGMERTVSRFGFDTPLNAVYHYCFFEEAFPELNWILKNPDNGLTFEQFAGANGTTFGGSKSVTVQFYNYSGTGRSDTLYSPIYTGLTGQDTLTFNWAYAQYQSENDRLIVKASIDGGLTYPYTIFDKAGSALATASATTNSFVPTASQWKTFAYPLGQILTQTTTAQVPVGQGWNIVSVPLSVSNPSAAAWFPNASSFYYAYNNGYQTITNVTNGQAFWARFDTARSYTIQGSAIGGTTVPLIAGWNLIGVYQNPVTVASVTTTPAGITNSSFYGYNSGYSVPTTLQPGKGYWIRTTQAGVLNLNTTAKEPVVLAEDKAAATLHITDATGAKATLLLLNSMQAASRYDLPPVPPEGVFDARFSSGRMAEDIAGVNTLLLQAATFPVTISVENATVSIADAVNGSQVRGEAAPGAPLQILNKVNSLTVSASQKPGSFALLQNAPNPFNPDTKIQWQLPVKSQVRITLYDVLGKVITELVNEEQEAGVHAYSLNASKLSLASGVYFYTMHAGSFTQTKKLVLMK